MALKGMVPEPRRKILVYDMNIKLKESRQKEETVLSNKDGWLFVTSIGGSHPSLHLTKEVVLPLTLNFMWFGKYFHKKGKKK